MKLLQILLILIFSIRIAAQVKIDSISNTVQIKSKINIFKSPDGRIIAPQEYMDMVNSGLYENRLEFIDDTTLLFSLDSASIIKTINTIFKYPKLIDSRNKKIKIKEGKPTVVNFWFVGCKPCIEEIPILNSLAEKYYNINFLAFTADSIKTINAFLKKNVFKYSIVPNVKNIKSDYKVNSTPTHLFIDKEGVIRKIIVGKLNGKQEEVLNWLESL